MVTEVAFIIFGYLCGSVLFAEITSRVFGKNVSLHESTDGNPGAANAFKQCGALCGSLTVIGDFLKGFLPIFLYLRLGYTFAELDIWKALIIASPVFGHAYPIFFRFKGGKGIAASFGCLLALLPIWEPIIIQAALYIFFSLIVKIQPHLYRSIVTYSVAMLFMFLFELPYCVILGYIMIALIVLLKHIFSNEPRTKGKVALIWKH